jgi:hypothetical protein
LVRPLHLRQDFVNAEARRLLPWWELFKRLDELCHDSLSRDEQERPINYPIEVGV